MQPVTGFHIVKAVRRFYRTRHLDTPDQELPTFLNSWLDGFKKHYGICSKVLYGKAGSVIEDFGQEEIKEIRRLAAEYSKKNVFNIDEAILF